MTAITFVDREFSELSVMLTQDDDNPTYLRELLDPEQLDFSLESLKHLDSYLEQLHNTPPQGHDLFRVALRCGAYIGEVMRKQAPQYHWLAYEVAAQHDDMVRKFGRSIATTGVLWRGGKSMCFPLGKVCKFIENGSEDSVYFFAKVLLAQQGAPADAAASRPPR